ncbi:hypothetical protein ACET3Z_008818 [Daucus carota]
MPFSKLKTLWKVNMPPVSLKTIDVSYSKNLKTIHDFRDLKLVEKLLLFGCKNLIKIHPSIGRLTRLGHLDLGECQLLKKLPKAIGKLTKLGHFDLRGCHSLERLPNPINQLTNLGYLNLGGCSNLERLPEQLGDMLGLKMLNVSYTAIERLPESIGGLTSLVSLRLSACKNLTILPNSIWKLKLLEVLQLDESSKLERLPENLGKMQSLKVLKASRTSIEELPDSIGLLSGLEELGINRTKVTNLPNSISNLTSLTKLYARQRDMAGITFPDALKILNLESLSLRCNVSVCLPIILSFTSLKSLSLANEGEILPSGKTLSLSKLSNLEDLSLDNFTSTGSYFPKLPLNVKELSISGHASLEQLPDLSNLKRLERLYIFKCISLQALLPLSPHLQSIRVIRCPRLQNLPDLSKLKELRHLAFTGCRNLQSVVIKPSSLQVGLDEFSSFEAHLPNREIAEWFSFKSCGTTVYLDIPRVLGDDFLGVALWVVYTCKTAMFDLWIRAVITNMTEGSEEEYDMYAQTAKRVGEVQSLVKCISGDDILVRSGDRIKVSFESLSSHVYCSDSDDEEVCGEVNVEMCGAHVLQKTLLKKKIVSKKRKRKSAFK